MLGHHLVHLGAVSFLHCILILKKIIQEIKPNCEIVAKHAAVIGTWDYNYVKNIHMLLLSTSRNEPAVCIHSTDGSGWYYYTCYAIGLNTVIMNQPP